MEEIQQIAEKAQNRIIRIILQYNGYKVKHMLQML